MEEPCAREFVAAPIEQKMAHCEDNSWASKRIQSGDDMASRTWAALESLAPLADRLLCILGHKDMATDALRSIGFAHVRTAAEVGNGSFAKEWSQRVDAIIVPAFATDVESAMKACAALSTTADTPAIIGLVFLPGTSNTPMTSMQVSRAHARTRAGLLHAGADDVISLMPTEVVFPHRLMDSVYKAEWLSKHVAQEINSQVEAFKKKATNELKLSYRRYLGDLPGNALENLPKVDATIQETRAEDASITAVGEFTFEEKLGNGAFGCVYKVRHPRYGICAMKQLSKPWLKNASMLVSLDREVCILKYFSPHPNLVRAYEVIQTPNNFFIVMTYAGKLNLHEFTKRTLRESGAPSLPEDQVMNFISQEVQAVDHLHKALICHRDLKPTNWIVSDAGQRLCLTDFGLAVNTCSMEQPLQHSCGSLPFCAPEVLRASMAGNGQSGYQGFSADMWSLGVNVMELEVGPFGIERKLGWNKPPDDKQVLIEDLEGLERLWAAYEPSIPELKDAVGGMLTVSVRDRWTSQQVVGPEGLAFMLPRPTPSQPQHSQQPYPTKHCPPVAKPSVPKATVAQGPPSLIERLGGSNVIQQSVDRMLAAVLASPGYSAAWKTDRSRSQVLRSWYILELPKLFGSVPISTLKESAKAVHQGLDVTNSHFFLLLTTLGLALREQGADQSAVMEATVRFSGLRMSLIGDFVNRASIFAENNTAAWRNNMLAGFRSVRGSVFVTRIVECIAQCPVLRGSQISSVCCADLKEQIIEYLSESTNTVGVFGKLLLGKEVGGSSLNDSEHLMLVQIAKNTMAGLGWPSADSEILYHAMMAEWEQMHFGRELDHLACNATEDELAKFAAQATRVALPGAQLVEEHSSQYDEHGRLADSVSMVARAVQLPTTAGRLHFVRSALHESQLGRPQIEALVVASLAGTCALSGQVASVLSSAWALASERALSLNAPARQP